MSLELKLRHKIATALLKPAARFYCRFKYNARFFHFKRAEGLDGPYLIVANHNSDVDPVLLSLCFPFVIFYVASDHIFRWGFISRLISYFLSPIPILKSINDVGTIRDIFTSLRSGASVCVFPEGQRSWCGETEEIMPSIGKLALRAGVPLLTCKIRGGYYSTPRWGDSVRRGRIACELCRKLSVQDIKRIGTDGINSLISKDLYVNADDDQRTDKVLYRGKNLAQSIETVLYTCPSCGGISTISSNGDKAACICGLKFRVRENGMLSGAPFITIREWNNFQKKELAKRIDRLCDENSGEPLFSDSGVALMRFNRAKKSVLLCTGIFLICADRFSFESGEGTIDFRFKSVINADICGRQIFQFSTNNGAHYEIRGEKPWSAYKYFQAYRLINRSRNGG